MTCRGAVVARKAHNLEVAGSIPAGTINADGEVRGDAWALSQGRFHQLCQVWIASTVRYLRWLPRGRGPGHTGRFNNISTPAM
jgi:hypothetical protein